ncbi:MAG: RHS repeat-associated core domain-containing protein [Pyrinomonadaceae bacterium]
MNFPYSQASRGVTSRKVYETAGSGTHSDWTYDQSTGGNRVTNPDGTQVLRFLHVGNVDSYFGYDNVLAGMPYRELSFSSSGQLQTQKLTYWTKSSSEWHPRVAREDNIIYNSSGEGLSSTAIYDYEGNLSYKETPVLVNKTTQYAYVVTTGNTISATSLPSAGAPTLPSAPSTPVRISESTYLINDTNYSGTASYYTNQNMVGLVTVSKVLNGTGTTVVAQSETKYDESGYSPTYRGNPTTAKVWKDISGNQYIQTHAKFDSYGNQYESIDAKGNVTTTEYDDTYYAFPVSVTSAVPDQDYSGTYGSTTGFITQAEFDFTTGLPLTTTDINGQTTTMAYNAATLRPTSVTAPNGQVTQYEYGIPDSETGVYLSAQRFVKVKTQIDASNWKERYSWVDGLGRTIKAQEVNTNGDVFALTCYDQMGRVQKSSSPFRNVSNPTCSTSLQWTTPTYDDMGRPTVVTSPDSTTVQISYGISTSGVVGVTKTVTDQAGRKRKGITDALGNMIQVIEDPDSSALATDYVFDTLGNLRKTTQVDGQTTQNRYFMHDSLGRLLYAKQPEQDANSSFSGSSYTDAITGNNQWSIKYVYDNNGNITSTTDARGKTISATYDHLNRLILRDYSDSAMADVTFYYDGKGLGSVPNYSKGKITNVSSTVSETRYTSFDNMGRILTSEQRTTPEQLAFTEGAYTFSYVYNLSGALIEETYPSGRKVKNTLNADGELSMVQSKKNSGSGYFTYADNFIYNSSGALTKMQLGNGHWENYQYNTRQQVTQIGLGTLDNTQDLLKLEFTYNTTNNYDNNGSMLSQKITVPNTAGNSDGFTATQTYTYDSLNRLQSAAETVSSQTWKQTFTYDRYGNRRFDTSGSNTTTIPSGCSTAICNPTIDTSNNRFSSGQSYTYDANGNLTQDATGKRFGYDTDNRQKEFFAVSNSTSNPNATYYYDGEGRRVKKISGAEITIFVYDAGGQLVAEYSTALADTQQVSYLTADHLGSIRAITNEVGQVVKRQDYSAFGDETVTSQRTNRTDYTADKEIRQDYTGYQKDNESGLEYAQARYYNSSHGRFTSADPLTASATIKDPQSFNRYSYALNSPYKFTDPLGLAAWCSRCETTDEVGFAEYTGSDSKGEDGSKQSSPPSGSPPPAAGTQDDQVTNPDDLQGIAGMWILRGGLEGKEVYIPDLDLQTDLRDEARWFEKYWLAYYRNKDKADAAIEQFKKDFPDLYNSYQVKVTQFDDGRLATPSSIQLYRNDTVTYDNPAKKFVDAANSQLAAIRAREENGANRFIEKYGNGRLFEVHIYEGMSQTRREVSHRWIRFQHKQAQIKGKVLAEIRR